MLQKSKIDEPGSFLLVRCYNSKVVVLLQSFKCSRDSDVDERGIVLDFTETREKAKDVIEKHLILVILFVEVHCDLHKGITLLPCDLFVYTYQVVKRLYRDINSV